MSWKLVVLVSSFAIAGAIVVASWQPWDSGGDGSIGGTKVTSWKTCIQSLEDSASGPSLRAQICRGLGWSPPGG